MKIKFTNIVNLTFGLFIIIALSSCYVFKRVAAPVEVEGNATFTGRIVGGKGSNNALQTGLSFFAVRVPSNWNVTVGENSYEQCVAAGVTDENGNALALTAACRYSTILSEHLNLSNPKDGYTWFAFQTTEIHRRGFERDGAVACDSICFNYDVINDGVAGDYELDYMIGSYETEDANYLENNNVSHSDIEGSDIYKTSTEQAADKNDAFSNVQSEYKSKVKVLEGGTPVDNAPVITAKLNGGTVDVEYKNLSGDITILKNAATIGCADLDYKVVGYQKYNNGTYTLDATGLEPGVYHVHSLSTGVEGTFAIPFPEFVAGESSLFVIGSPGVMAPEILVSEGRAFLESGVGDAALYTKSPEIMQAMVDSILAVKPTAVLVSGDLTMAGEKVSHDIIASLLKKVTDAGIKVFVVPGDKDINNVGACIYDGETITPTESITPEEFVQLYGACGYNDAVSRDESTLSYMAYVNSHLAVLALDACQYNNPKVTVDEEGIETIEQNALGEITQATLDWATEQVATAQASGRQVVAMMHHLVAAPYTGYASLGSIANNREAIDLLGAILGGGSEEEEATAKKEEAVEDLDAYAVQDAIARMGLDVIFVGDADGTDIQKIATSEGKDFYQVCTGAATAYNCPFRLVNVGGAKLNIQTRIINNLELEGMDGMTFEEYAYYRTKTQLPVLVSTASEENWDQIHAFLVNAFTFDYDPDVDLFDKNQFFKLPETAEEGAAIVNDNIIPPLVDVVLAFVDGNENYKKSADLVQGMHDGVDGAITAINTFPSIINPMVKEGFANAGLDIDAMIDSVVSSIAYNYVGEPTNVINDLFVEIPFTNSSADGIKVQTVNNGETTIFNIAGQKLTAPVKGVNIINGKKMVVK